MKRVPKLQSMRLQLWVMAALLLLLVGCGRPEGTLQLPEQASNHAAGVDWVFYFIYWLNLFYFVHIMGIMGWFMWRYRRRPGVEPEESPHHSTALEIAWSIPPVILVVFMFYWGFTGYMNMVTPPADAYKIEVTARKWSWTFTYPNGAQSDLLQVPPNEPIELVMTSEDVLHAFYIPKFRVKQDVVPGKTTNVWFTAIKTGGTSFLYDDPEKNQKASKYKVFCAEYCGTNHSKMWAAVKVHESREDFEEWLKIIAIPTPDILYKVHCKSCHNTTGTILVGPSFKGLYGSERKAFNPKTKEVKTIKVDEAYLRESILEPGKWLSRHGKDFTNEMESQNFADRWKKNPEYIDMLVEFIKEQK